MKALVAANLAALKALGDIGDREQPTAEERQALAGWAGWGVMATAFDQRKGDDDPWQPVRERLFELVSVEDARAGAAATPFSYYTPRSVTAVAWRLLTGLGFPGGRVLEPGCGHGCFMADAPTGLAVEWTGIEQDPVSARIAGLLHPQATILQRPLEQTPLPPGGFDAVIGNVPFADVHPYDPAVPKKLDLSLHNYFIYRALHAVRPGGLVVVVTSRYTMDASFDARAAFEHRADLVGAIRMASGWEREYGSDVVADLLVLRRRPAAEQEASRRGPDWLDTPLRVGQGQWVNTYWRDHPEQVLGTMHETRGGRYGMTLEVRFEGDRQAFGEAMAAATNRVIDAGLAAGLTWRPPEETEVAPPLVLPADAKGRKEGSYHRDGEGVVQIVDGKPVEVSRPTRELMALIELRDATLALLEAEADPDAPDADQERAHLNGLYDLYRDKHGAINRCSIVQVGEDAETGLPLWSRRRPSMGGFRQDPDYVTVLALEDYDDETAESTKAPILLGRVNRRPRRAEHTDSPAEAVAISLDEHGKLWEPGIAFLLGIEEEEVAVTLGDLAYRDPVTRELLPADEYLSGNVRLKLAEARAAAEQEPDRWARNVRALEAVMPRDLRPEEIRVRLGAPWVDPRFLEAFIRENIGQVEKVTYEPVTATWAVDVRDWLRTQPAATSEWGTSRMDAYTIVQRVCNGQATVVYDESRDGKFRNAEQTMLAEEKAKLLQARWAEWLWEDEARTEELVGTFNVRFNSVVVRHFDGRHLTFPGMADTITPYPWQRNYVFRGISTEAGLCGHDVGAGKTWTMFALAMKLRQLGLAQKPLITVPNHLLEQVSREGKRHFPEARILMASSDDVSAERRRLFAARCATRDWDVVVMTHSAFTALGVHPDVEHEYLEQEEWLLEQALYAQQALSDQTVKAIQKMIARLGERLRRLMDHRRDAGVTFEQLGCDYLLVDEAHYFKNLGVVARSDGFSMASSKRAVDLAMKLWWLRRRNRGRVASLFTGTPVSNTLAEVYVLQRYLQPDRLEELGLLAFDAWAAQHVMFETRVEVAPDGGSYRLHRRPSKFMNVTSMRRVLAEVADILPAEKLTMQVPNVEATVEVVQPSRELVAYVQSLVVRADKLRGGGRSKAGEDNMLRVCGDGRKAALDLSLVGIRTEDPGKVGRVVERVAGIWREHEGGTAAEEENEAPAADLFAWAETQERRQRREVRPMLQVLFCDLGTPREGNSQVYGKIRQGLIAAGMDGRRIRFAHEAKTDAARMALFNSCRAGEVDVLIGSTDKLGVGTNIQTFLYAVHHVDAPWRPADVRQRRGRMQRPGNTYAEVREIKYVTERSFDAYMWQTLERKARFIGQVLSGDLAAIEVEDIGDAALSYAEVKALATGNRRVLELTEAQAEVVRLDTMQWDHARQRRRLERESEQDRDWSRQLASRARTLGYLGRASAGRPAELVTDEGQLADRADIGRALAGALMRSMTGFGEKARAGTYQGLEVHAHSERVGRDEWVLVLELTGGYVTDRVPVKVEHLSKGQTWRLAEALADFVDTAAERATDLQKRSEEVAARAAEAERQAKRPFPEAKALREAQDRLERIEAAIRAEAEEASRHVQAAPAQPEGEAA